MKPQVWYNPEFDRLHVASFLSPRILSIRFNKGKIYLTKLSILKKHLIYVGEL